MEVVKMKNIIGLLKDEADILKGEMAKEKETIMTISTEQSARTEKVLDLRARKDALIEAIDLLSILDTQ